MKVLEVEVEYNRRRKPVYEKRARLIRDIEQFWLHVFMQVRMPCLVPVACDAVSAASTLCSWRAAPPHEVVPARG